MIDSHCHLDHEPLLSDLPNVIKRSKDKGIEKLLTISTSFESFSKILEIINKDKTVAGFNLGTNIGKVSGQSIHHCHFHLIPRREGDVENPQGGVRSVIPNKQHYRRKK